MSIWLFALLRRRLLASFSIVVNIRSAAWLLDALAGVVFAIAAADVRQLVRVRLPVHWIGEALAMARLVHRWTGAATGHSTDAADAAYAADGPLLNAAGLGANHVDARVVRVGAVDTDRGVAWSLVWTAVIDSVLGRVRMVAARAHWDAVLLDVEVSIVSGAASGGASTIYTIGRRASGDHNALTVLEGSGGVRAHDIAEIRGHVGGSHLGIRHDAVDDRRVGRVHVVLATLIAAVWIARMVRVVGRGGDDAGVRACARNRRCVALSMVARILLRLAVVAIVVGVAGVGAVGGVVLFARLWTDATEASETRAALARVVVMVVVVVRVAN